MSATPVHISSQSTVMACDYLTPLHNARISVGPCDIPNPSPVTYSGSLDFEWSDGGAAPNATVDYKIYDFFDTFYWFHLKAPGVGTVPGSGVLLQSKSTHVPPEMYLPTANYSVPIFVTDRGARTIGFAVLTTAGTIAIGIAPALGFSSGGIGGSSQDIFIPYPKPSPP